MAYLLDADVFIRAKNDHYGFDFCPAFWSWLEQANAAGVVHSVEAVHDELRAQDDQLAEWVRDREAMFLPLTADDVAEASVGAGVGFGSAELQADQRCPLVEDRDIDGTASLPSSRVEMQGGGSRAVVLLTELDPWPTDHVWFDDLGADGSSRGDKRTPLLDSARLGPCPESPLDDEEHARNNLPDVLARWTERDGAELDRERTDQSFCVPVDDIVANDFDLSINRYKEIVYDEVEYPEPTEILDELDELEGEIQQGLVDLKAMLG